MEPNSINQTSTKKSPWERIAALMNHVADPLPFYLFLASLITAVGLIIYGIRQWLLKR